VSITSYPALVKLAPTGNTVSFGGTNVDAFGRLRVSNPFTLFDSQNRYAADTQFDTSTATGGTLTHLPNESTNSMAVTSTSGSSVIRQTYRVFPYQPGKGLLIMATFVMNASKTNLRQRVGYFNTSDGVFLEQDGTTLSFVLRSNSLPTPGTPSDTRKVTQANWNVDKLDGTGPSGITLDITKTQILWMDFEWLGVGQVRCGFFQDGQFIVCHKFDNENVQTAVYMTTAILPLRYEITNTGTTASASTMKQICSTVISEGGYEAISAEHIARMTSTTTGTFLTTTFKPLVSIRLSSSYLGAIVLPFNLNFLPTTSDNYELALFKNSTLTTPTYTSIASTANVEQDIASTSMTGGTLVYSEFTTGKSGRLPLSTGSGYNWDLQIGCSLSSVSDVYTLAARTLSGTGGGIGSLSFYDLT
jgi:hypothetical protein